MDVLKNKNYVNQSSIECVIFGYEDKTLKVLVSKLNFKGDFYALQGGFILQEEDVDEAAKRILEERTGIKGIYLEQFKVFGKADRKRKTFIDKLIEANYLEQGEEITSSFSYQWFTSRFISIGYYALVDIKKVSPTLTELDTSIEWCDIHDIPDLIMDYNDIFEAALTSLKEDIDQKLNAFNLLPEKFTINEVQEIYETIFEKTYVRTNFQKKILEMNVLERLEKKYTGAKNKAPYLYKLRELKY